MMQSIAEQRIVQISHIATNCTHNYGENCAKKTKIFSFPASNFVHIQNCEGFAICHAVKIFSNN